MKITIEADPGQAGKEQADRIAGWLRTVVSDPSVVSVFTRSAPVADIVTLGMAVDCGQVKDAMQALDDLVAAAKRAEAMGFKFKATVG